MMMMIIIILKFDNFIEMQEMIGAYKDKMKYEREQHFKR